MEGLPKIAKEGMLRQQRAEAHPEAGVLTAFLEQALDGEERDRVLGHLAVCRECREVVRLAAAEPEAMQPVLALPAARGLWSRMGVWQWGAAVAAVVVVASAIVVMQPRLDRGHGELTASSTLPAAPEGQKVEADKVEEPAAAETGKNDPPQAPASLPASSAKKADAPVVAAASGEMKARADQAESAANATVAESKDATADAQPATAEPSTRAKAQTLGGLGVSSGLSGNLRNIPRDQIVVTKPELKAESPGPAVAQAAPAETRAEAPGASTETTFAFAKEAEKPARSGAFGLPAAGDEATSKAKRPVLAAGATEWRIADDGQLQRLRRTPSPSWNTVKVGSEKLQILAFRGPEIWVGGRKGRLYKSVDNGMTWIRVKGAWGKSFTIVGLSFKDEMNGELRLENGELWTSRDGGGSWSKH